jgi:hypothetical protein
MEKMGRGGSVSLWEKGRMRAVPNMNALVNFIFDTT